MSGAITATAVAVGLTVGELFTAVAITGAVVGAVGAVTGVKPLQYAGLALGAIGGIGGLAASAGLFATDAFLAGGLTSDAGFAGAVGGNVVPDAAIGAAGGITSDAGFAGAVGGNVVPGGTDIVNMVSGEVTSPVTASGEITATQSTFGQPVTTAEASPNVSPAAATNTGPANDGMGVVTSATLPDVSQTSLPQGGQVPTAPSVAAPGAPDALPSSMANNAAAVETAKPFVGINNAKFGPTTFTPPTDPFSDILSMVGKPGVSTLLTGAIQAGGAFIAGATSTLTPAQVAAYNAQAQANLAASNLTTEQAAALRRQAANMTTAPVASRVTGNTGMINSAPPPQIPVTGAPA